MSALRTLIDPDLPLCWEDEVTLRLGFDRPVTRLDHPSPAAQRLVTALRSGVDASDPEGLEGLAQRCGAGPDEARRLLTALLPSLTEAPAPPRPFEAEAHPSLREASGRPLRLRIALHNEGSQVPSLLAALSHAGCLLTGLRDRAPVDADLVVVVERYLEPLERVSRIADAGVPHLLVRLTDRSLLVGPLVADSGGLCLSCTTLALVDRDPGLPAVAAQLIGTRPPSETPAVLESAGLLALWFIRRWLAGDRDVHTTQLRAAVGGGIVAGLPTQQRLRRHPRCPCADTCLTDTDVADIELEGSDAGLTDAGAADTTGAVTAAPPIPRAAPRPSSRDRPRR